MGRWFACPSHPQTPERAFLACFSGPNHCIGFEVDTPPNSGNVVACGKKWEGMGDALLATGTYPRAMDSKHRVLLPKPVRASILDTDRWYATPGSDGCLELHSTTSIRELGTTRREPVIGPGQRQFERLFFSQAECLEIDGQGRIRIPRGLVDYADLESPVVIIGAGSHWELWTEERWRDYVTRHSLDWGAQPSQSPLCDAEESPGASPDLERPAIRHPR